MTVGLVIQNLNLKPGGCIRVQGEVAADPKSFTMNLGKDENNLNLHFNPRFKLYGDVRKLIFNSRKAGAWETELRDSVFPLEPGSIIEVCVSFDEAELTTKLPDGHIFKFPNRHNVDVINYLEIHGDLKLKCLMFE
ncbi:galectin-1 [Phyllostomus hastatus]|uniref:galectin-1 n=1 Tax=Phyllostomus hastatus TaxID=9423 RepID=UPI001E680D07|nr:galectin-1 [Phyllostomus hastatus]